MDDNTHACPLCGLIMPVRHAACGRCWPSVPARLRRRLARAWTRRGVEPLQHRVALAEFHDWARMQRDLDG